MLFRSEFVLVGHSHHFSAGGPVGTTVVLLLERSGDRLRVPSNMVVRGTRHSRVRPEPMIEVTIAVCPPEGERRVVAVAKIENISDPTNFETEIGDYRITLEQNGVFKQALSFGFRKARGAAALAAELLGAVTGCRRW